MPRRTGIASDPKWREERARKAARARHSLDSYIRSIVERSSELTPEQCERIAELLAPAVSEKAVAAK